MLFVCFFFFKQKTAYEMRISDWSSDVCSSDLLFPLYMLVINIFVLPIAVSGLLHFPAGLLHPDFFVLAIPMQERAQELAMFAFIGGLSAATGMVIVSAIALSPMICTDPLMPSLLPLSWLPIPDRGAL